MKAQQLPELPDKAGSWAAPSRRHKRVCRGSTRGGSDCAAPSPSASGGFARFALLLAPQVVSGLKARMQKATSRAHFLGGPKKLRLAATPRQARGNLDALRERVQARVPSNGGTQSIIAASRWRSCKVVLQAALPKNANLGSIPPLR